MTTYYISPNGSNSNNGLGPDASDATNKPWLTLAKAMQTGSPVAPGDTVYLAPGYYYSAQLTAIAGISSVASPTQIIGDPQNRQGFKDGSGVLLAAGMPWVTTRTSAEGLTNPIVTNITNNLIDCSTNSCKGLQFKFLGLEVSRAQHSVICSMSGSSDILIEDCFSSGSGLLRINGTPTAARNMTIRRCIHIGVALLDAQPGTAAATADADLNILFEECMCLGSSLTVTGISLGSSGGNKAGGVTFKNNTVVGSKSGWGISTTASQVSTTTPIRLKGNLFIGSQGCNNIGTSGQVIDDGYNQYIGQPGASGATNTNLTDGTGTMYNGVPNLVLPHLVKWGLGMPRDDFLGWTDAADALQKFSASGLTSADFHGHTPRPWGAGASIGCWQVPDVAKDTSSAITGGGTNSIKFTGAGEISLYIPVDAVGQTISITTKSTSYGGTNYPQMVVVANPSIGVTSDITATASSATEQTITTATITPTAKGVMEVRLISRSTSASSSTFFDILSST